MNKTFLIEQLLRVLEAELDVLLKSAAAAREEATHAETKPENKYDTRGLEASYLAGAQAERAAELRRDLQLLSQIALRSFTASDKIAATAVVTIERDGEIQRFFILPVGGGTRLNTPEGFVTVVTPQSPLVRSLQDGRADLEVIAIA